MMPATSDRSAPLERRTSPHAAERILYRTRDDILTDERLITGGATHLLGPVMAVRVVPTRAYVPVQVARGVALFLATVLMVFTLAGLFGRLDMPFSPLVYLLLASPFGFVTFAAPWFIPLYGLQLRTPRHTQLAIRSSDFELLQAFAVRIHAVIRQRDQLVVDHTGRRGNEVSL